MGHDGMVGKRNPGNQEAGVTRAMAFLMLGKWTELSLLRNHAVTRFEVPALPIRTHCPPLVRLGRILPLRERRPFPELHRDYPGPAGNIGDQAKRGLAEVLVKHAQD